jgi:hypothetical protein
MSTSEPRVFSFKSEEQFRKIPEGDILDGTSQTVITYVCGVPNGHSFGAALSMTPLRDEDFPGNVFHGWILRFETCCLASRADAEKKAIAWARLVKEQLRHTPQCDFMPIQM